MRLYTFVGIHFEISQLPELKLFRLVFQLSHRDIGFFSRIDHSLQNTENRCDKIKWIISARTATNRFTLKKYIQVQSKWFLAYFHFRRKSLFFFIQFQVIWFHCVIVKNRKTGIWTNWIKHRSSKIKLFFYRI